MKLITKEVEKKLEAKPLRSQEGKLFDAEVALKLFDPSGRLTLFVTEAERQDDGDWLLFGYMLSPLGSDCDEWGYSSLKELQAIKGRFGLGIERDMHTPSGQTVRDAAKRMGVAL